MNKITYGTIRAIKEECSKVLEKFKNNEGVVPLKEAVVEKHDVDWDELARDIASTIEFYSEAKEVEDTDVFAGTEDAYAEEVLEQNLYDNLLFSGLFTINSFEEELKNPSYDGNKLDMLYRIMLDEIENGSAYNNGDYEAIIKAIKEFDSTYVEVKDDKVVQNESIKEGVKTEAGNDFDEIASYMYNEANGDIDYIPSFEQTNDYIVSVTKREYNDLYGEVKTAIENVAGHIYNGYIELSDRATMNSLYGDKLEEVDPEEAMSLYEMLRDEAFKQFEDETKTEIWQDGRSGRHIIVDNNYLNAIDYDYLCRVQKRLENWVIAEFARKMAYDDLEESIKDRNGDFIIYRKTSEGPLYISGMSTTFKKEEAIKFPTEKEAKEYLHEYIENVVDPEALNFTIVKLEDLNEAVKPEQSYIDFLKRELEDTYEEEQTDKYLIIRGERRGKPIAAIWYGKAAKPQIYLSFVDEEQRESYIKRFLDNRARREEEKIKRRYEQRLTKDHNFKVGDIFYTSWGYDQTNIDFYEVVKVRGSRLDLRELRKEVVDYSGQQDIVKPIPGEYASDKIYTISARADGSVTGLSSFEYPSLWDGQPLEQTNSYFGH